MILAEKITEERKKNGWSQEELAEMLGVSRQAVSKWESAGAVPDLQRVIRLAELFGVSTDYLLKDDAEPAGVSPYEKEVTGAEDNIYRVSMEEAQDFLAMKRKSAPIVADATSMCILSPSLLVLLSLMSEAGIWNLTENLAAGIGLLFLFGMVAAAVFMFITNGVRERSMAYLERNPFETEYGVDGMVKERKYVQEGQYMRGLALGVILCILSVIPLVIGGLMEAPDYILGGLVVVLLLIVAVGVNLIIRVSTVRASFETLLQEADYTKAGKRSQKKKEALSGVYWSLVTALYLGWSFWTMRWDYTWIIWPVAAVLSGAIFGILRMFAGDEE